MSAPQQFSHWPAWPLPILEPAPPLNTTTGHPCTYLPGRIAGFRAFQAAKLSAEAYQQCMDAGFRRSGQAIYQPVCHACRQCIPLRVPVEKFQPSKSQRRALRRNADLTVRIATPNPTAEKWNLYQRYQRDWHDGQQLADPASFIAFLYLSPVATLEFEYRDPAGKLLGVGLCDLSPNSLSSVYFYFDPAHRKRSLGTFSALYEILWTREMKI